ncbi:MAG: hypothetical protein O7F12_02085 [Nitrospirae bacterium]|nr:hypothetical protein [Nitrospirota bacterium]
MQPTQENYRIATGKVKTFKEWLDYVGKDHLHHRLARALGGCQRNSVLLIFALTVCLGLGAMALRTAELADAIILLAQAALIVTMLTIFEFRGRPEKNLPAKPSHENHKGEIQDWNRQGVLTGSKNC